MEVVLFSCTATLGLKVTNLDILQKTNKHKDISSKRYHKTLANTLNPNTSATRQPSIDISLSFFAVIYPNLTHPIHVAISIGGFLSTFGSAHSSQLV